MNDNLETEFNNENPRLTSPAIPELSQLMVLLLNKGVLYRQDDERRWHHLLRLQNQVREQAAVLLLELIMDEAEGYAFFKSRRQEENEDSNAKPLPRLIARRPLSYPVSLMLALLRRRMLQADTEGGDTRLILTREEIAELIRSFLSDSSNQVRLMSQIDSTINKVIDLGFLRKLQTSTGTSGQAARFEVMRIIKAFVDAQWSADFEARLQNYRNALSATEDSEDVAQ